MNSDDVAAALADPATLAMLKGMRFMKVDDDEIQAVAQAIADAHHRKPGADASGRLDDARTIIAAIDALVHHRAHDASTKKDASKNASKVSSDASGHVQDASLKVNDASQPVQDASHDASQAAGHVIPMAGKKRSKKTEPSA